MNELEIDLATQLAEALADVERLQAEADRMEALANERWADVERLQRMVKMNAGVAVRQAEKLARLERWGTVEEQDRLHCEVELLQAAASEAIADLRLYLATLSPPQLPGGIDHAIQILRAPLAKEEA